MAYKLIDAAQARWRAVSAPIWSPWSVPARCSTTASSSNAPSTSRPPNPADQLRRRSPEKQVIDKSGIPDQGGVLKRTGAATRKSRSTASQANMLNLLVMSCNVVHAAGLPPSSATEDLYSRLVASWSAERTIESRDALTPSAGARTVREISDGVRVDHHIEVACKPQSNRVVVCVLCGQTIASAIAMCPSKPSDLAIKR